MFKTKLIGKRELANGTMEFTFERPTDFTYKAGQTTDWTILNPQETDVEGNMRTFSLVSAPHEETLRIASRMRDSAFKRNLKNMPEGTELSFTGPYGSFLLHENSTRPAIFLAGGIGVTPFHSILADVKERKLPHKIVLFYSNRRPEDAAYLEELHAFATENPNLTLVPTMTGMEKSAQAWDGEQGHVDPAMLSRYVPENTTPIYYIAGPQAMVLALHDTLTKSGVSSDDIRFEEFAGY